MSMTSDIAALLVSLGHGSTTSPNPTIFTGNVRGSPDSCIILYQTEGRLSTYVMGASVPANVVLNRPGLQIVVRDPVYTTAETKATSIFNALNGRTGTMGSKAYARVFGRYPPVYLGVDENDRYLFSLNFIVEGTP